MADAEKLALQQRNNNLQEHIDHLHGVITDYERQNAQLKAELEIAKIQNQYISEVASAYEKDIEKLERERDAALIDMKVVPVCRICKHQAEKESFRAATREIPDVCIKCITGRMRQFEWRGVQENGGAE